MSSSEPASRQRESGSSDEFAASVMLPSLGSLCIKQQVALRYQPTLTCAEDLILSLPVWLTNIELIPFIEASEF